MPSSNSRRVRFLSKDDGSPVDSSFPPFTHQLTTDVCRDVWYHQLEIAAFKQEVGSLLVDRLKQEAGIEANDKVKEEFYGLERYDVGRHAVKSIAIKRILNVQSEVKRRFQEQLGNPSMSHPHLEEILHSVSVECSGVTRNRAIVQGIQDYWHAYPEGTGFCIFKCNLRVPLGSSSTPPCRCVASADVGGYKRQLSDYSANEASTRRVRARIAVQSN